ncbi:hypothetical protein NOVA_7 [Mycobacterium phage Nova]|uniref:Uncharacterized protein n=1 Tax=Mycobacterium phage Nova TaxID=1089130 RepID=G8IAL6_9CAUD|nr:hypothetical protein NOVA_7 [Mycobacterium phage Nova]
MTGPTESRSASGGRDDDPVNPSPERLERERSVADAFSAWWNDAGDDFGGDMDAAEDYFAEMLAEQGQPGGYREELGYKDAWDLQIRKDIQLWKDMRNEDVMTQRHQKRFENWLQSEEATELKGYGYDTRQLAEAWAEAAGMGDQNQASLVSELRVFNQIVANVEGGSGKSVTPEVQKRFKLPSVKSLKTSQLMDEWDKRAKVHDFSGSSSYGGRKRLPNKADDDFLDDQMKAIDEELRERWHKGEDLEFWFPYG